MSNTPRLGPPITSRECLENSDSPHTTFTYDADGNLTAEVMGTSGATDSFGYDAADRMTSVSDTGTFTAGSTYTRDKAEQLTQEVPSGGFGAAQLNAGYDSNERTCYTAPTAGSSPTCAAPPPAPTPYVYDAADNVTLAGATSLSYNAAQQPCWSLSGGAAVACNGTPTSSYTQYGYDARGDRTSVGPYGGTQTTLTYDAANRMTSDGPANTYSYGANGLRMSKTVSSTTTAFAWDLSGGLPSVLREGTSTYDIYDAHGLPLEQISGGVVAWYHHDQLGSTRAVTSSTGSVLGQYAYDAYGNLTSGTQGAYPFLYAGQYRDSEFGLYYLRARYYDPITAQFLSPDPMVATTRSPYGYVGGNPLNGTDPTGECGLWGSDTCWGDAAGWVADNSGIISTVAGYVQAGADAITVGTLGASAVVTAPLSALAGGIGTAATCINYLHTGDENAGTDCFVAVGIYSATLGQASVPMIKNLANLALDIEGWLVDHYGAASDSMRLALAAAMLPC